MFHAETTTSTNMKDEDIPLETSVLDLFDEQAQRHPSSIAAAFQGKQVTYGELYNASILVAARLMERGFKYGDRIPLVTNMGLEMVAAVLGVLRLGAAYCPLDANAWSMTRIFATLNAVGSKLVFSTMDIDLPGYEIVGAPKDIFNQSSPSVPPKMINEFRAIRRGLKHSDLIYIIFTSGTTGKPKGVMIQHSSATHLVKQTFPGALRVGRGERILLFFSVAFDGCAGVIFSTVCNGGTLAMATPSDVIDVAGACTTLIVTPSILGSLEPTPKFDQVRSIYMGGEAPTEALVRAWTTPTRKVYNAYGPTECTTAVSTVEMIPGSPIVLGNVVSDVELILLDEDLEREVEQGEICIRGPCLAAGYLNNEALTQEKFFMRDGTRHYRTGDLARRDADGLHFVARVDRIVKNRGFLINLEAEVEPALRSGPGVKQAAACMSRQKQLLGFVTPEDVQPRELQDYLKGNNDAFIVPDLVFPMDKFPLTSNGKVDFRALQALAEARVTEDAETDEAVTNEQHPHVREVMDAFAAIFDRPDLHITPRTSFQALGGNSLIAIKLIALLRRRKLNISVRKIFEIGTIASIAQALVVFDPEQYSVPEEVEGDLRSAPLTPSQADLLRETMVDPSSNYVFYSLTRAFDSNDGLSTSKLKEAWETVLKRHEIYRMTFDLATGIQTLHDDLRFQWHETIVLTSEELMELSEDTRQTMRDKLSSQSNLTVIPPPQFWVFEIPGRQIRIDWVLHHVYIDAWSFGIILDELRCILDGCESELRPPQGYLGMARYLNVQLNQQQENGISAFWRNVSEPWPQLRQIQLPAPDSPHAELCGTYEANVLVKKTALDAFAARNSVSSGTVIYTAWALLLMEYTASQTVGMKCSVSGRNLDYPSADRIVGSLIGRCPLIVELETDESTVKDTLSSVQSAFTRVHEMQWTYPELEKHIPQGTSAYSLDSFVLILLDMPVDSGQWKIFEFQKLQCPIWLGIVEKNGVLNMRLRHDMQKYATSAVHTMAEAFIAGLEKLVESPGHGLTIDISRHIRRVARHE